MILINNILSSSVSLDFDLAVVIDFNNNFNRTLDSIFDTIFSFAFKLSNDIIFNHKCDIKSVPPIL